MPGAARLIAFAQAAADRAADITLHCVADHSGTAVDSAPRVERTGYGWRGTDHRALTFEWRNQGPSSDVDLHYRAGQPGPDAQRMLPGAIEAAMRLLLPLFLAERQLGVLVHGAGFLDGAATRASLAVGESGAGKSTLSALVPPTCLLSDELTVLRCPERGGVWQAHSSPFGGDLAFHPQPRSGPLAAAFVLHKAAQGQTERLSAAAVMPLLARCLALPLGASVHEAWVFDQALSLACVVPWRRLHFRKDAEETRAVLAKAAREDREVAHG